MCCSSERPSALVPSCQSPTLPHPLARPPGYFSTKIFHPNVSASGEICVNVLKRDWKPDLGLRHVLTVIRCLLIEPNAESGAPRRSTWPAAGVLALVAASCDELVPLALLTSSFGDNALLPAPPASVSTTRRPSQPPPPSALAQR